jgi:site-specific DNA recombinase
MIEDAKAGKIDLILCKSISRFARNTVLTIQTIRELKAIGVEVYFDNERMSTFDEKTEFMLSIISSMAQEESRHISENVKWTFQKMMKEGKPIITTSRFLGYTKGEDGNLVIVPEEAEIIKLIYTMYDEGCGIYEIRRTLRKKGYKTVSGSDYWHLSTIQSILRNEKYKGDVLLQKTFTIDYLTHKAVKNRGQVPSYYVTNSHEPIIDPDMWERVQERIKAQSLKLRGANRDLSKYNTRYPLSGMLICNECGETYKRRQWISGYKVPKIMYQCNRYIEPKLQERCHAKPISENLLLVACAQVINELFLTDSKVFAKIANVIDEVFKPRGASTTLTDKIAKKEELEKTINLLLSERANATSLETRTLLDKQYVDACDEYSLILKEIEHLQDKEQAEINLAARYKRVKALIDGKQVTPEMINKDILDVFLYRIIVVDRNDIVITINVTKTIPLEELRKIRKEIAERKPLYEKTIKMRDPKKMARLHYKVVLV